MSSLKVIAVDNNPVILRIVSNILEEAGCEVQSAVDGLAALDLLTEFEPDIIVTDLIMPKIDGAKLTYIIRSTPAYKDIFLMKEHILHALERFKSGKRGSQKIKGLQGLFPRAVTSELLVHRRHNQIIFDRMTEGVLELDSQTRVIRANPVCCDIFKRSEAEVLGSCFTDLLPQDISEVFRQWTKGLSPHADNAPLFFNYENPIVLHDRQVTCNLASVFENDQVFVIGIIQDVTARKRLDAQKEQLEKELQQIRKLEAVTTMASGIAHDFNNLLTIINGNVEMARLISTENEVDGLLGEIGKALQLTNGLIRQFSTFSDNYLPSKTLVYLDELLTELMEKQFSGSTIVFQVRTEDNIPRVDLDTDLMVQVFSNIILNAAEAMDGRGELNVEICYVTGKAESERTGQPLAEKEYVRVSIEDSGPGIEEQLFDKVFDPYFSTKQRGTQKGMGLGLTIAHAIVNKHGGVVRLHSEPGNGCTALIYLPVGREVKINDKAGPFRVLVLDDDEMMRTIVGRMFEQFKCEVTTVDEGELAVLAVKEGIRNGLPYDLVLLDLRIDIGMDGIEAAREIHHLDPLVSLVAMSGDSQNEVMSHFQEYHFITAVTKPFSIDTVTSLLNTYAVRNTG